MAGHVNISTTRKYYLAIRPQDMDEAAKVVNAVTRLDKVVSKTDTKLTQTA